MCGRYTLSISNKPDVAKLGLQDADRFNIAPQSQVLIRTRDGDHATAHWGIALAGSGSRQVVTNARSETLSEKPLFRGLTRCAFLADGGTSGSDRVRPSSRGITTAGGNYFLWRACPTPIKTALW